MTARKVFNVITMILIVYLFINLFIPFIGDSNVSFSLWEYLSEQLNSTTVRVLLIVELIFALLVCVLQICGAIKDYKGAYLFVGYYFGYHIAMVFQFIESEIIDYAKIGLWLGLIMSILTVVSIFIGNLLNNEPKHKEKVVNDNDEKKITGYDPKTGKPIYEKEEEKKITGYDPKTGKPIYEKQKEKKIVGYDTHTGEPIYAEPKGYDPKTGEPIYE